MKKSLYELVDVPPMAPRDMIASACRRRIAKLELDTSDKARTEIYAVREAWSILGDDKLRAGYDASLAKEKPIEYGGAEAALLAAEIAPDSLARTLLKPRRLLPENWERYRKLVFVMFFVGLFALSAVWNQSRRVAVQKRLEAAEYEASYGEAKPDPKKAAKEVEAKPAEPFSADKFEKELKEREAAIREQVANEQTAKEDEFRQKNQQESDSQAGRRRSRYR